MGWNPSLGAIPVEGGTRFRAWATAARRLEVLIDSGAAAGCHRLHAEAGGFFSGLIRGVVAGDRYRYRLDGNHCYPDPASRFQPLGVHGPSEVVDPRQYTWRTRGWTGLNPRALVFYELHIGTFTPEGTFASAVTRLPYLRGLGVTAIELMPVADFPGGRNWGYDGAALYAPARCYGAPDDLRALVDEAHGHGLAVYLDVVYNHFGPDGAYAAVFSPEFYTRRHKSPWGKGINFDGKRSREVRRFFVENALHWIHEYQLDGLRLDATPMIQDDSPRHIAAEISESVCSSLSGGRRVRLIAEDYRNLAHIVKPTANGGWGMDAVWSDDFHHGVRRCLAGDSDAYFADFSGSASDIAETVRRGWFFTGQNSSHYGGPRGTDPEGIPPEKFVFFIQNHDMIGNRAFGDRLHHGIGLAAYRAATALLLLAPETPLLFMGQEWAASTPFLFFTDHHGELGTQVRRGRRKEFRRFREFSKEGNRHAIPDPQAAGTFTASKLRWEEIEQAPHLGHSVLCRELLRLRRELHGDNTPDPVVTAVDDQAIVLHRSAPRGKAFVAAIALHGPCKVRLRIGSAPDGLEWRPVLDTEEGRFADPPKPCEVSGMERIGFRRPGAIVFRLEKQAGGS